MEKLENPFLRQVDGNHYTNLKMQPIEVCQAVTEFSNYAGGAMFKHLLRYPHKGEAVTDLEKAKHYYDHARFSVFAERPFTLSNAISQIRLFCEKNEANQRQAEVLYLAITSLASGDREVLFNRINEEIQWIKDNA